MPVTGCNKRTLNNGWVKTQCHHTWNVSRFCKLQVAADLPTKVFEVRGVPNPADVYLLAQARQK